MWSVCGRDEGVSIYHRLNSLVRSMLAACLRTLISPFCVMHGKENAKAVWICFGVLVMWNKTTNTGELPIYAHTIQIYIVKRYFLITQKMKNKSRGLCFVYSAKLDVSKYVKKGKETL